MANTKKTTTKKGSTAKKASSSKKSTTKAKSTPKKNNKKSSYVSSSTGKRVPFSEQYYNAIMLCYLLGGALMLALALIKGSNLWTGLRSVLFSAFGISFYLLTVQTIVIGVRMALHNLKRSLLVTNISGFLLSGSFAGIIHLIMNKADDFGWTEQLKETAKIGWEFGQGDLSFNGGILGAVFGGGPLFAFGKGGAFVMIIALFLVSLFFHLGIETESFGNSVSGAINGGKKKLDESAGNKKIKKVNTRTVG